jgi:hypothetical protein
LVQFPATDADPHGRFPHFRKLLSAAFALSFPPLNEPANSIESAEESICLKCGLCCNGVIFADVKLQPGDGAARLRLLGLALSTHRAPRFKQPCAALDGCRCRIYAERPRHCSGFECLLLQSVTTGRIERAAALRVIGTARDRAEKVRRGLRALGDSDEGVALGARFRRTARRMEKLALDDQNAEAYAQLTLAVHDLNLIVSEAFYR